MAADRRLSRQSSAKQVVMAKPEEPTPEELDSVLADVPRGAMALAGLTVLLLLIAWFAIYFLVFLPRGQVG
jgi:hypothetical protein